MVETINAPVVRRLRETGDEEAAATIERLENALVSMYREHQVACEIARRHIPDGIAPPETKSYRSR